MSDKLEKIALALHDWFESELEQRMIVREHRTSYGSAAHKDAIDEAQCHLKVLALALVELTEEASA
jgi:hypothetical protein